eukprot:UN28099
MQLSENGLRICCPCTSTRVWFIESGLYLAGIIVLKWLFQKQMLNRFQSIIIFYIIHLLHMWTTISYILRNLLPGLRNLEQALHNLQAALENFQRNLQELQSSLEGAQRSVNDLRIHMDDELVGLPAQIIGLPGQITDINNFSDIIPQPGSECAIVTFSFPSLKTHFSL